VICSITSGDLFFYFLYFFPPPPPPPPPSPLLSSASLFFSHDVGSPWHLFKSYFSFLFSLSFRSSHSLVISILFSLCTSLSFWVSHTLSRDRAMPMCLLTAIFPRQDLTDCGALGSDGGAGATLDFLESLLLGWSCRQGGSVGGFTPIIFLFQGTALP